MRKRGIKKTLDFDLTKEIDTDLESTVGGILGTEVS